MNHNGTLPFIITLIIGINLEPTAWSQKKRSERKLSVEIKNRKYPKKKNVELTGNFGAILNQSYVQSWVASGGLSYFLDESTGYGLEFSYIINSDKEERKCIENFYNKPDPNDSVTGVCASTGDPAEAKAAFQNADGESYEPSMGPAYPPIRQLDYLISGYWVWNPVYGKQLFFMSGVAHFDVFIKVGGGVAMSQLFPLKTSASDGTPYRGTLPPCEGTVDCSSLPGIPGIPVERTGEYGLNGRPEPLQETTPMFTLGVGQRYHLADGLNLRIDASNYTLVGTEDIFEMYFVVQAGLNIRF